VSFAIFGALHDLHDFAFPFVLFLLAKEYAVVSAGRVNAAHIHVLTGAFVCFSSTYETDAMMESKIEFFSLPAAINCPFSPLSVTSGALTPQASKHH
jgi:hypothetical protein